MKLIDELIYAIKKNDTKRFDSILAEAVEQGCDLNESGAEGKTPLNYAVEMNNIHCTTELLLCKHVSVTAANKIDHAFPVLTAARVGAQSLLASLIAKKADLNQVAPIPIGTALMAAIEAKDRNMVYSLLHLGADPNLYRREFNQEPPIVLMVDSLPNSIPLLVGFKANINVTNHVGHSVFTLLILGGHENMVRLCLGWAYDHKQLDFGNFKGVYVETIFDVRDGDGLLSVEAATLLGIGDVVKRMLSLRECGLAPSILVYAAKSGSVGLFNNLFNVVREKFQISADEALNQLHKGQSPLSGAAWHNRVEMIADLIKRGAKVDGCGDETRPLYIAARKNNIAAMEVLIKHGATVGPDVDVEIQAAMKEGNVRVVALLLKLTNCDYAKIQEYIDYCKSDCIINADKMLMMLSYPNVDFSNCENSASYELLTMLHHAGCAKEYIEKELTHISQYPNNRLPNELIERVIGYISELDQYMHPERDYMQFNRARLIRWILAVYPGFTHDYHEQIDLKKTVNTAALNANLKKYLSQFVGDCDFVKTSQALASVSVFRDSVFILAQHVMINLTLAVNNLNKAVCLVNIDKRSSAIELAGLLRQYLVVLTKLHNINDYFELCGLHLSDHEKSFHSKTINGLIDEINRVINQIAVLHDIDFAAANKPGQPVVKQQDAVSAARKKQQAKANKIEEEQRKKIELEKQEQELKAKKEAELKLKKQEQEEKKRLAEEERNKLKKEKDRAKAEAKKLRRQQRMQQPGQDGEPQDAVASESLVSNDEPEQLQEKTEASDQVAVEQEIAAPEPAADETNKKRCKRRKNNTDNVNAADQQEQSIPPLIPRSKIEMLALMMNQFNLFGNFKSQIYLHGGAFVDYWRYIYGVCSYYHPRDYDFFGNVDPKNFTVHFEAQKRMGLYSSRHQNMAIDYTLEPDVYKKIAYASMNRDLTIAALVLDAEGNIYDPTGRGYEDLCNNLLHIIDPVQSLQEDPCRVFRIAKYMLRGFIMSDELKNAVDAMEFKSDDWSAAQKLAFFNHYKKCAEIRGVVEMLELMGVKQKLLKIAPASPVYSFGLFAHDQSHYGVNISIEHAQQNGNKL